MNTPSILNVKNKELNTPLTADAFAKKFGYPPAMVRLTIECGLEAPEGRITGIAFCKWLAENYNEFRARAGLPLLEIPRKGMSAEECELLTIGNVIRTHADYFASRTSSLDHKEEWMSLSNDIACRSKQIR